MKEKARMESVHQGDNMSPALSVVIGTEYSGSSNNKPAAWQESYLPSQPVNWQANFQCVYEIQWLLAGKGPIKGKARDYRGHGI